MQLHDSKKSPHVKYSVTRPFGVGMNDEMFNIIKNHKKNELGCDQRIVVKCSIHIYKKIKCVVYLKIQFLVMHRPRTCMENNKLINQKC